MKPVPVTSHGPAVSTSPTPSSPSRYPFAGLMVRRVALTALAAGLMVVGALTSAAASGPNGVRRVGMPAGLGLDGLVCAPASTYCWATGSYSGRKNGATVLFSPDGGATWLTQWTATTGWGSADQISCPDTHFCLVILGPVAVVGARQQPPPGLLVTADGGHDWSELPWPATGIAAGQGAWITCAAANQCLLAGGVGGTVFQVFRTTDGGRSWSPTAIRNSLFLAGEYCLNASLCWLLQPSSLAESTDGGLTWSSLSYPAAPHPPFGIVIDGLSFVNARDGWMVGGTQCGGPGVAGCPGYIFHTADGGQSWQLQQSLRDGPFLSSISCSAFQCAVVGTFPNGSEMLTFSGSGRTAVVPGTHLTDAYLLAPVCGAWGCMTGATFSPGNNSVVLTTSPLAAVLSPSHRPWLPDLLPTFQQVSWKAQDVARSAVAALLLLMLIGIPGQVFNSTLLAHYEEVTGWFAPLRRLCGRIRLPIASRDGGDKPTPSWQVRGVFVLGGVFGVLLDPKATLDSATAADFAGILVASAFVTSVYTLVHALALHRLTGRVGHMRIYWTGVGIAAACVLISRVLAAQPGYLYGVLLGYTLGQTVELKRHHEGRLAGLSVATVLMSSVAIWLLWTPVKAAAASNSSFLLQSLSTAMAGVFLGGMTWLVFGMLPLRWLDGEKLFNWRRVIWAAAIGLGLFLYVHVVLWNAASAPHPAHSLVVTAGLFVAFGLLSIGFWSYFRFRPQASFVQQPARS